MGKKHEGGPGPERKQLAAPQVSVPTLGWEGGEGGTPDGRQGVWRRGAFLVQESVCVCVGMYVAGVCLPVAIGAYICVSAIKVTVYVLTCVCKGRGQA